MQSLSRWALLSLTIAACLGADPKWVHLTSRNGDLPDPGGSNQQTGLLVANLDKSKATGFVISYRVKDPALVWYRYNGKDWSRYVIEKEFLRVEAGGAAYDIDGDGDLDIAFGGDAGSNELWWWENPYPNFDPNVPWKRHIIKKGGANQHHDQIFADFKGTGKAQLVFWNQKAKALMLADIPADPRHTGPWPMQTIFSGQAGEGVENSATYAEGIDAFDVDGDGRVDQLAGNYWFKYEGGKFRPIKVGTIGGRIRAGKFKPGKTAQIVIGPGDGSGPLKFYEAKGDPAISASWQGRDLLGHDLVHGHTLDVGDIDGDGNLDIFAAEMAKWSNKATPDYPDATAWILYGDGKRNFRPTVLVKGDGWHEGKLADVDGDGDLDVINKPYTWDAPRIDLWLNNGTKGMVRTPGAGGTPFRADVGMELWTYRHELTKDLPGTLAMIRKLGFTDVETASFYGRSAAEFRRILDQAGLKCSSLIAGYDKLDKNLDAVAADARALGAKYVLTAGFPHKGAPTVEQVEQASAAFNRWGEKLKAEGFQFGYHPHGFEFVPAAGGGNLFDTMLALTKPGLVTFEMDVFWFAHGGADPVKYLQKYPNRFSLVHLKDLAKGTPTGAGTGRAPDEASVPLGAGQLDMPAILRAAEKARVTHYYIEDESPVAAEQVPVTLQFLKKVRI
jgi:sugar phosphate isomerase/epimerase